MHESFSSGCLCDLGEGIREKREGWAIPPVGFEGPWDETKVEHLDHGLKTIFWTGGSSCCRHKKRPNEDSSSQMQLLQILWFMETCKEETTDFGSRFNVCVKSYLHNVFFGCLRTGLLLCTKIVFQYERKSLQLRASPPLQTDSHWLAKRSDSSLSYSPLLSN